MKENGRKCEQELKVLELSQK